MKCDNLLPPKNGFLQYSHSLEEGSIVSYSCMKGYEIRQRGSTRKVFLYAYNLVLTYFSAFAAVWVVAGLKRLVSVIIALAAMRILSQNRKNQKKFQKNNERRNANKND